MLSFIATLCGLVNIAQAESTTWIGATGDWFSAANWKYVVPTASDQAHMNNGGTAEIHAGGAEASSLYLGTVGWSGTVNHTGGTLNAGINLAFDTGSTGTYNLSGTGHLSAGNIIIGRNGRGYFDQTAGTVAAGSMTLASYKDGTGVYNLLGGQVSVTGNEIVADHGIAAFNQSGGTHFVQGNLTVGLERGSLGRYTISGGRLSAQELRLGYLGTGTFEIQSAAASISLSRNLLLGVDSKLIAAPGSTIQMTGASLDNCNANPLMLLGLSNLGFIFDGGTVGGLSTFEVAGKDIGAEMSGFEENFAFDALILGGIDVGQVQLVDWRDNMPSAEALYVKSLKLGSGSYLDLNGLNLYYLEFENLGGTVALSGGELILVPEPATLLLLGLGAVVLRRKR